MMMNVILIFILVSPSVQKRELAQFNIDVERAPITEGCGTCACPEWRLTPTLKDRKPSLFPRDFKDWQPCDPALFSCAPFLDECGAFTAVNVTGWWTQEEEDEGSGRWHKQVVECGGDPVTHGKFDYRLTPCKDIVNVVEPLAEMPGCPCACPEWSQAISNGISHGIMSGDAVYIQSTLGPNHAKPEFQIYKWSREEGPINSGDYVSIQKNAHYLAVSGDAKKGYGINLLATEEAASSFRIYKWSEEDLDAPSGEPITSGDKVYIMAVTPDNTWVEVSGDAGGPYGVNPQAKGEDNAQFKIEKLSTGTGTEPEWHLCTRKTCGQHNLPHQCSQYPGDISIKGTTIQCGQTITKGEYSYRLTPCNAIPLLQLVSVGETYGRVYSLY